MVSLLNLKICFSHVRSSLKLEWIVGLNDDCLFNSQLQSFLLQTFDEAQLCESLRKNVSKSGYVKPTPVQKHGIPIISAGRDLMACAQTGSGKTVRWASIWVSAGFRIKLNTS